MAIGFAATMLLLPVTAIGQDKALGKKSHRGNLKPFAGVKISRVTAERITADTDIDIDIDRPGTPLDVFAQDNVTSVEFTWKDADKGFNGGYVDKTTLSHKIYTFENIYGNITKTLVAETGVGEESYTLNMRTDEGKQELKDFGVSAVNATGESDVAMAPSIIVGAPYELPFAESFKNGKLDNPMWWARTNDGARSEFTMMTEESSDGNGCILYESNSSDDYGVIGTGKLTLAGAIHPKLEFTHLAYENSGAKIVVAIQKPDGTEEELQTIQTVSEDGEWIRNTIDIDPKYGSLPYLFLQFTVSAGQFEYVMLDEISITDQRENDMAVKTITLPPSVKKGDNVEVKVTVENRGLKEADGYKVKLYADGKLQDTKVAETALAYMDEAVYTFSYPAAITMENSSVELKAEVEYEGDMKPENNTKTTTLTFKVSDKQKPESASVTDNNNGTYTLQFRVRDDQDTMKDGLTVDIGFNKEYSQNTFTLTYDGTDVTWTTNDGHPTGIYSVTAVKKIYPTTSRLTSRDYLDVTVEGVFAKVPDGTPMDITVTATDAFGNAGSVSSTGHPVNYVEPKVIERKTLLGMTFNQPVRPVESWAWHEKDGDGFKTSWTGAFPISGNGTWSIQYKDAFGQIHAEEITINDFTENGKDYSLALSFSTTDITAEAVTMTTNAANGTVKVYEINGTSHTEMRPVDGSPGVGTQKRQTPINENMETQVEVMDGGVIYRLRVYIDNIVSGAPKAEVHYYVEQLGQEFTAEELTAYAASGVTVTGNIRAWYNTARHVTPTGDTGSAFLFTPGGAASHTFTYEDDLGNAGSVTAALPARLTLQAPTQPPEDTTAPTVDVDIYVKRAGSYTRAEAFLATDNQTDIDSKFGNLGYVQGYNLAVNAIDASGFTIAVTGDGAALNGNTVTITKAGTYTVTVTDKSPGANKTEFTFTVPDRGS